MSRRRPIFGPEPWRDGWSHWDLWMCLVAVLDHGGDLESLEQHLVDGMETLHGRDDAEAKWSHAVDLHRRLDAAGLTPHDLVDEEHVADRTLVAKARRKVAGTSIEYRAMTPAMIETPRVVLRRRAQFGSWPAFPASPQPWYDKFKVAVEAKTDVGKYKVMGKVAKLEERLQRLDRPRLPLAERLALYRACHTAFWMLAERRDDSFGEIGRAREEVWRTYLAIDWRSTGMEPAAFYQDLCELVAWEDYGLGHREETLPFRKVRAGEVEMVADTLLDLERELREVHLRYFADEALCQVAWLYVAKRRLDGFEEAAGRLGTDHWIPIVAMAEAALDQGGPDAAYRVFAAADRPGMQRAMLADRCRRLSGRPLRHLRAMDQGDP